MNLVVLTGRLARDPELKYIPGSGQAVAKFSIAVDRGLYGDKKKEAEEKGQATADFINIICWGKMAENVANYQKKGNLIAVQGRIQTGSYEKEGAKVYTFEVVASNIEFLESRKSNTPDGFHNVDEQMPWE